MTGWSQKNTENREKRKTNSILVRTFISATLQHQLQNENILSWTIIFSRTPEIVRNKRQYANDDSKHMKRNSKFVRFAYVRDFWPKGAWE